MKNMANLKTFESIFITNKIKLKHRTFGILHVNALTYNYIYMEVDNELKYLSITFSY